MSILVSDIHWEGGEGLPPEYTLENVLDVHDIEEHLFNLFGVRVITFEYFEL